MSICGIYKIQEKSSGKCYIGQSIDIDRRIKEHRECNNKGWEQDFYNFPTNFSVDILEECSPDLLNSREKYYIEKYNSYKNGFNKTSGNGPNLNKSSYNHSNTIYPLHFSFNEKDYTRLIKMIETPSFKDTIQKLLNVCNVDNAELNYLFARAYPESELYIVKVFPLINKSCKAKDIIYLLVDLSRDKEHSKTNIIKKTILNYCEDDYSEGPYHSFFYIKNTIGYKCSYYYQINPKKYYGMHKWNDEKLDSVECLYLLN